MKILQPVTTTMALLLGLVGGAPQASADWIETFTGGFDNQSWSFFDNDGPPPSDTTVSTSGDVLTLQGDLTAEYDLTAAGVVTDETFTDVLVRATVSPTSTTSVVGAPMSSNNDMFVVARSDGNFAYLLALDYNDGDVDLGWVEGMDFNAVAPSISAPDWFDATQSYVLELLVHGTDLRGRVFSVEGDLLAELTGNDATLASGWSGVGAALNNDGLNTGTSLIAAAFDNVSSTAVPEPSTLLLAIGGVVGMVAIRRRRAV